MSSAVFTYQLLISLGAAVMLVNIYKFAALYKAFRKFRNQKNNRTCLLYTIHLVLMILFFCGYLVVGIANILDLQLISNFFVGSIFFFGALFVLLGIFLQKDMLLSMQWHYSTELETQQSLQEERTRLSVTLESIGDGVIATDIHGTIQLINHVAVQLTGWKREEAIGKNFEKVFRLSDKESDEYYKLDLNDLDKSHGLAKDTVLVSKYGEEYYLSTSASPIEDENNTVIGYVLIFRDITHRRNMEEEVLKGKKLESVGLLAGGIAHDFNNLLTGVLGNISLAERKEQDDVIKHLLTDANNAARMAKDLTHQLLTFSKGGDPILKPGKLEDLVKESAKFILRGSTVKCEFSIPDNIWPVEIDKGQINQVINNLVLNAEQSMPEGGKIHVFFDNIVQGLETNDLPLPVGNYVKMSIEDHGVGIPKDNLAKIFDPYFTTKDRGNGLGLASTYSIILKHNGYITADSKLGEGTVFHVYLPASGKIAKEGTRISTETWQNCDGVVMIMDDDDIVRSVTGKMLENAGFKIINTKGGEETVKVYKYLFDEELQPGVILMDLTIPGGMGGKETIKKLLEIDPNVKAIVGSGYSNDPVMGSYKKYGFKACIPKPYVLDELLTTVLSVIEGE